MLSGFCPKMTFDVPRLLVSIGVTSFPYVSFPPAIVSVSPQVNAPGETLEREARRKSPAQFSAERLETPVREHGASTRDASTYAKGRDWEHGLFAGKRDESTRERTGTIDSRWVHRNGNTRRDETLFGENRRSWFGGTVPPVPEGRGAGEASGAPGKTRAVTIYEKVPSSALLAMMERLNTRNDAIRGARGPSESQPRHFEEKHSR